MSSRTGSTSGLDIVTNTGHEDISYAIVLPRSPTSKPDGRPHTFHHDSSTDHDVAPPLRAPSATPSISSPQPSVTLGDGVVSMQSSGTSSVDYSDADLAGQDSRRPSSNSMTYSNYSTESSRSDSSRTRRHSFDPVLSSALAASTSSLTTPSLVVPTPISSRASSRRPSGHLSDASFDMSPTMPRPATAPPGQVGPSAQVAQGPDDSIMSSVQAVLHAAPLTSPWSNLNKSKAYYLPRNALLISDNSLPNAEIVAALEHTGWTVDPMALSIPDICSHLSDHPPSTYQLVIVSTGSSLVVSKELEEHLVELAQTVAVLTEYPTILAVIAPSHLAHRVGPPLQDAINTMHSHEEESSWPEDQSPVCLSIVPAPPPREADPADVAAWAAFYAQSWNQTNVRNGHLHFAIFHRANFVTIVRALDSAGDAVKLLNANGIIEYANQEFAIMTGVPVHAIIGLPMADLFKGHNEHLWEEIKATITAGDVWRGSVTTSHLITKSLIHQSLTIAPILVTSPAGASTTPSLEEGSASGSIVLIEGYVVVIRDVTFTTRKLKDERYNAAQAAEKHRFLMSTVNETIHDLRNEVNALSHYTSIVEDSVTAGVMPSKETMSSVVSTVTTLRDTMSSHLDINKALEGKLTLEVGDMDVVSVIESALDLTGPAANAVGTELVGYVCPSVPSRLRGDTYRLRQVVHNLLTNAVKFTKRGTISISVFMGSGMLTSSESPITIPALTASPKLLADLKNPIDKSSASGPSDGTSASATELVDGILCVRVADTGIGIKADSLPQLFKPFTSVAGVTTKHGGSGLGLSICKQVVELMGGSMTVSSTVGQGTEFVFSAAVAHAPANIDCHSNYPDPIPIAGMDFESSIELPALCQPQLDATSEAHITPITPRSKTLLEETHVLCLTNSKPVGAWIQRALADIGTGFLTLAESTSDFWTALANILKSTPQVSPLIMIDSAFFNAVSTTAASNPSHVGALPPKHPFSRRASVIHSQKDANSFDGSSSGTSHHDVLDFVSALKASPQFSAVPAIVMAPIGDEVVFEAAHGFDSTYIVVKPVKQSLLPSLIVNAIREARSRSKPAPTPPPGRRPSVHRSSSFHRPSALPVASNVSQGSSVAPASTGNQSANFSDIRRASTVTNPPPRPSIGGDNPFTPAGLAPSSHASLFAPRVLVVDDSVVNLKMGERILTKLHVNVTLCQSGKDALDAFNVWTYDVIFLDIAMPDMDGLETARAMRLIEEAHGSSPTPIIALTGGTSPDDQHAAYSAGMNDFIAKPLKSATIEAVLRAHLTQDRLESWKSANEAPAPTLAHAPPQTGHALSPVMSRARSRASTSGFRTQMVNALSLAQNSQPIGQAAAGVAQSAPPAIVEPSPVPSLVLEGVSESRSPRLGRSQSSPRFSAAMIPDAVAVAKMATRRHASTMNIMGPPALSSDPPPHIAGPAMTAVAGETNIGGAISFGQPGPVPNEPLFAASSNGSRPRSFSNASSRSSTEPVRTPVIRSRAASNASSTTSPP